MLYYRDYNGSICVCVILLVVQNISVMFFIHNVKICYKYNYYYNSNNNRNFLNVAYGQCKNIYIIVCIINISPSLF